MDAVDLPPALSRRAGRQAPRRRELVPGVQDRARQRAGDQRLLRAASGREGRAADAGPVVLHHQSVCPAVARLPGDSRLVALDPDDSGQLDRTLRRRRADLRDARRSANHGVHDASGHGLRRDLPRAGAGARPGGRPDHRGAARRRERLSAQGVGDGPGLPQGRRQGQDRRLHRLLRAQSSHRRCRAGLDRRLRPDGVRHGRDHGGARPRPARLRIRRDDEAPMRARRRGRGAGRVHPAHRSRARRPGRADGQQPRFRRNAVGGGQARHHPGACGQRSRQAGRQLPAA